jgi:hypothetical protein
VRVREASIAWEECAEFDGDLAFAVYLAALDCEEHAADIYAAQIERVREVIDRRVPPAAG